MATFHTPGSTLGAVAALVLACTAAPALAYDTDAIAWASVSDWRTFSTVQPWAGSVRDGDGRYETQQAASYALNPGGSIEGQSAESWTLADLATGRLAAYSRASVSTASDHLSSFGGTMASISDTFSARADANPYHWNPTSTGRFDLTLTGSAANAVPGGYAGFQVVLYIDRYGSHNDGYVDTEDLLGAMSFTGTFDARGRLLVTREFFDGDPTVFSSSGVSGSLAAGGVSLFIELQPAADFDWTLMLVTSADTTLNPNGQILGSRPGTILLDFGHTLATTYTGPDGTLTASDSGLFPGTVALVPEPASTGLWLAGLLVLAAARLRPSRGVPGLR